MRDKILKFRAWDIHNKTFTYWTMNDLCTYAEKDEKPSALDDWQQDTGLLDKNGKEIYEGDIVVIGVDPSMIGKVEFLDGKFTAYWKYRYPSETDRKDFFARGYASEETFSTLEIIGNIYENPELLTV